MYEKLPQPVDKWWRDGQLVGTLGYHVAGVVVCYGYVVLLRAVFLHYALYAALVFYLTRRGVD